MEGVLYDRTFFLEVTDNSANALDVSSTALKATTQINVNNKNFN